MRSVDTALRVGLSFAAGVAVLVGVVAVGLRTSFARTTGRHPMLRSPIDVIHGGSVRHARQELAALGVLVCVVGVGVTTASAAGLAGFGVVAAGGVLGYLALATAVAGTAAYGEFAVDGRALLDAETGRTIMASGALLVGAGLSVFALIPVVASGIYALVGEPAGAGPGIVVTLLIGWGLAAAIVVPPSSHRRDGPNPHTLNGGDGSSRRFTALLPPLVARTVLATSTFVCAAGLVAPSMWSLLLDDWDLFVRATTLALVVGSSSVVIGLVRLLGFSGRFWQTTSPLGAVFGVAVVSLVAWVASELAFANADINATGIWLVVTIGAVAGVGIAGLSLVVSSDHRRPANHLARQARGGATIVLVSGISVGFRSAALTGLVIAVAASLGYWVTEGLVGMAGGFGIALVALGAAVPMMNLAPHGVASRIADHANWYAANRVDRSIDLDALRISPTPAVLPVSSVATSAFFSLATTAAIIDLDQVGLVLDSPITVVLGVVLGAVIPFLLAGYVLNSYIRPSSLQNLIPAVLILAAPGAVALAEPGLLPAFLAGSLVFGVAVAVVAATTGGLVQTANSIVEAGAFGGKGSATHSSTTAGVDLADALVDHVAPPLSVLLVLGPSLSLVLHAIS